MKKIKAVKYIFKGFVQGVGFRSYCHYHANKVGISGSVRNLSNGNVEVIAIGPDSNLSLFFERTRKGPPGCYVEDITTEELSMDTSEKGFRIL